MKDYALLGLTIVTLLLGAYAWRASTALKVAQVEAKAAKERTEQTRAETDSVLKVVSMIRDSLKMETAKVHKVVEQASRSAVRIQRSTDSAVAALRTTLDSAQAEKLDSVVSHYNRRIAVDSIQIAALNKLILHKDEEIATFRTEVEQLKKFNRDLQAELEAREPKLDIKSEILSAAISAVVIVAVDRVVN